MLLASIALALLAGLVAVRRKALALGRRLLRE